MRILSLFCLVALAGCSGGPFLKVTPKPKGGAGALAAGIARATVTGQIAWIKPSWARRSLPTKR